MKRVCVSLVLGFIAVSSAIAQDKAQFHKESLELKLSAIDFKDAKLSTVIGVLRAHLLKGKEGRIDINYFPPKDRVVLKTGEELYQPKKLVNLKVDGVPTHVVLDEVAKQVGVEWKLTNNGVEFRDKGSNPVRKQRQNPKDLEKRAKKVIIPIVDFENATLGTVVAILRLQNRESDPPVENPFNYVIKGAKAKNMHEGKLKTLITYQATNSTLYDLLDAVARLSNCDVVYTQYVIEFHFRG